MKRANLCAMIIALFSTMPLSAAVVGASASGPGGTSTNVVPQFIFTSTSFQNTDFTSINYIDLSVTVNGPGTYTIQHFTTNFTAGFTTLHWGSPTINDTGVPWIGFQITSLDPVTYPIVSITNPGSFTTVTNNQTTALLTGGPGINDNGTLTLSYTVTAPAAGTFIIRETPIAAVPEASTLTMMSLAGLGAISFCWRRRCI